MTARDQDGEVERSVLSEQVKDRLLKQIVDGELPPGSRIVETKVAKEFGTSQAPVREALRALSSLGLVEVRPHRGAWVREPSPEELAEAAEVRGALEAFAAEQAAKTITDKCIRKLERLVDEMGDHFDDPVEQIGSAFGHGGELAARLAREPWPKPGRRHA